ncbi:DmsC/YnfH family molybdoenzyme membrane anchor subunit [Tautonia plasticadhaerens]|uniref:Anaerobic dimethyl sulfoxide reductase chain B n=1 Tax=Tautonia plasticadhaerens TaxID=2527974 RepID=A0A518H4H7_9BACT|nr:DmsC/YnfH family molybdoenzyme membrane anchor subunit [Tautonia plasticadhaerens]QDV35733.1 Anaerobic dimethyl sulfoxide reductase chain B [Tautonia plasticadhaerens]
MSTSALLTSGAVSTTGPVDAMADSLLRAEREVTAVEQFSRFHDEAPELRSRGRYAELMPASPPGPGQQYAFEVELDRCSGCKACVTACHALNGLDEGESWRDVGLLVGGHEALPVLQHVTTSCHHCVDPACANACPVDAYEKDPVTGIVRHLDDQCIGCKYCTMACPYDAPKYHAGEGIVRKCDLCSDRLRVGEAPACVRACPHEAIRVRVVDVAEVEESAAAGRFLPSAPDPSITGPSTRYRASRPLPADSEPADAHRIEAEHAHGPLVVMLVLTQLAAGGLLFELIGRLGGDGSVALGLLSLGGLLIGLMASLAHLGRPHLAYRAVIGLRHSWLSREVVCFGAFAKLAGASVGLALVRPDLAERWPQLGIVLAAGAVASGVAGVACSVMVYHVTRRPAWTGGRGVLRFAGTVAVLGLAARLSCRAWEGTPPAALPWVALAALVLGKVAAESELLDHRDRSGVDLLGRSSRVIRGPLAGCWKVRVTLGLIPGVVVPLTLAGLGPGAVPGVASCLSAIALAGLIAGELLERFLFFAAASRPKMPGGLHS